MPQQVSFERPDIADLKSVEEALEGELGEGLEVEANEVGAWLRLEVFRGEGDSRTHLIDYLVSRGANRSVLGLYNGSMVKDAYAEKSTVGRVTDALRDQGFETASPISIGSLNTYRQDHSYYTQATLASLKVLVG